jgi:hypothetical protein
MQNLNVKKDNNTYIKIIQVLQKNSVEKIQIEKIQERGRKEGIFL